MYYYRMVDHGDWVASLIMAIVGILFVALIIMVIIKLSKNNVSESENKTKPIDIVKERYAKGEIKKDEFEQFKKDLIK